MQPLRIRHFRALWTAAVFSNIGTFLHTVAASWAMYELTRSPLWVGLMAASSTLPLLFLSLPAGAIADIFDRRKILLAALATEDRLDRGRGLDLLLEAAKQRPMFGDAFSLLLTLLRRWPERTGERRRRQALEDLAHHAASVDWSSVALCTVEREETDT